MVDPAAGRTASPVSSDILEIRVVYDVVQGVETDLPEADVGVPVLGGAGGVFAVVDVEDRDLIPADEPVKRIHDAVEVVDDVVAAVACVAGVKADPQLVIVRDAVVDPCQFLELRPISEPFPAIVSRAMHTGVSAVRMRFSPAVICRIPASTPAPTWAPGWRMRRRLLQAAARSSSSARKRSASS